MKKHIALVLALSLLAGTAVVPVNADSEDPVGYTEFAAETAEASEPTEPTQEEIPQTQPQQIPPEETEAPVIPEETEAAAAVEETVPQEKAKKKQKKKKEEEEPEGHNGVPLYFQTDYPNNMYGMGTIANNGCSAACLAMVATYLTGHEYLPDEIARYFGGAAENNIARLEKGSKAMQLPFKKAKNWHETNAAIHDGKIAIVLMESDSIFTDSQHFIILTGLNDEGKLMVNDSYEPNYDRWETKKGLRTGFEEGDILLGYSGAWIYDPDAMPEEPFLYSEPEPVRGEPRYGVELTWEEIQLLAKVIWVEARGESDEGQQAVAEVVLNRLVSGEFADTLSGVIHTEGQFNSAKFLKDAEPYQRQYEMVENALYGPYILPMDVYYFATTPKTEKIWGKIGGHFFCYPQN